MTEKFDIRDWENPLLREAYDQKNYCCIDTGADSNICYIFFSSNGLYYPDTEAVFRTQILEKNRYEWKWVVKNSRIPNVAGRIIYVRDIYKCWYSKGINSKINTIDKVIVLLKELTNHYRVITVGSSAGGYMAVLSAIMLKAGYCLNFSGQYHIAKELGNPYCDLTKFLGDYGGEIFYFVPAYYEEDRKEYLSVRDFACVKAFLFDGHKHASTMLTGNMCDIVDCSEDRLLFYFRKYEGKKIKKMEFLFYTVPVPKQVKILRTEIKGFIIRKLRRHWNGI